MILGCKTWQQTCQNRVCNWVFLSNYHTSGYYRLVNIRWINGESSDDEEPISIWISGRRPWKTVERSTDSAKKQLLGTVHRSYSRYIWWKGTGFTALRSKRSVYYYLLTWTRRRLVEGHAATAISPRDTRLDLIYVNDTLRTLQPFSYPSAWTLNLHLQADFVQTPIAKF